MKGDQEMNDIKVIKSKKQYQEYLKRVDELFHSKRNTKEGDELELLLALVKLYEDVHYQISYPDPIEAIKSRMEDLGLQDKDLVEYMGDKGNVSKILNRKRALTIEMIRKLSKVLSLPTEVLIGESNMEVA